jgi:hypothetical protein
MVRNKRFEIKRHILYVLIFFVVACDTPATLDFDSYEPQIAVNCLFTHGQYFNVNISKTVVITESVDWPIVENAEVTIKSIKKNIIHSIPYQEDGNYYDSLFTPEFDEAYQLTVNVPGYETMTAFDSLPAPPSVTDMNCFMTNVEVIEPSGYKISQLSITILDNKEINKFYEIGVSSYYNITEGYIGERLSSNDPIIIDNDANKYYGITLIFSNELFCCDSVKLLCTQSRNPLYDENWHSRVVVYSLSEKLFKFRNLLRRHKASSYDIVFPVEPVIMSSGIDNGYGIFAGYMAEEHYVYPSN